MFALVYITHCVSRFCIQDFPFPIFFKYSNLMLAIPIQKFLKALVEIRVSLLGFFFRNSKLLHWSKPVISAKAKQTQWVSALTFSAGITWDMRHLMAARWRALIAVVLLHFIAPFLQHPHLFFFKRFKLINLRFYWLLIKPASWSQICRIQALVMPWQR